MITLTSEEAQQVLDALEKVTKQMLSARDELGERGGRPVTNTHHQEIWDKAFEAYTDHAIPAAETLRARLSAPEPEPVAYAGCTVWIGNARVTQSVSKLSLIHERNEGMSLTNAAQKCLYLIAKAMRGNNND